jgi:hypothetical protein
MIFRFEPTGLGIRIALPGCGHTTTSSKESVSWIVRPAPGEHPRFKNKTELKDVLGRAVVKRASASQAPVGRVGWCKAHDDHSGADAEQYVVDLSAPDEVFARIAELAREGKPPSLTLEPDGSGKVWDNEISPHIMLKGWRADVQVTPDEKHKGASARSPLEAQLAQIRKSIASARTAAWAGAAVAALLVLLRLL